VPEKFVSVFIAIYHMHTCCFLKKKYPAEREFFSHIFIVRLSKIPDRIYKGRHLQKGSRDPVSSQLTKKSRDARMLDSGHYKMKKVGKVAAGM
jgi:hypothetical protein